MSVSNEFPYGRLVHLGTANALSKSADYSEYDTRPLGHVQQLMVILHIASADRTDGTEVYDFYVTSKIGNQLGSKVAEWDLIHFPQIATTGEKIYAAIVEHNPGVGGPNRVTTAVPGVSSLESGTIKIDTAAADQGVKTLAAGTVRHGWIGEKLGFYLVTGGATPGPVVFSIYVLAMPE